jgi:TRAP transporter 4TM/12TM fusion protein
MAMNTAKDTTLLTEGLLDKESGLIRKPRKIEKFLLAAIAFCWSIFQLSTASWLILDALYIRAIHLGFALVIAFLGNPFFKKRRMGLDFLSDRKKVPVLDYVFSVSACLCALYIVMDYVGITTRYGIPITRDIIVGIVLIVLLLDGTRRAMGPTLAIVAIFFCFYAFLGPHMPQILAFKAISLSRFIGQITMSTEGIYGIPLDVSANIVFLFVLFGAMLEKAGAGRYFINLALTLLGRYKGGPAKAAVLGSSMTGMVSGSSIANVVTTGTFTIPLMKKAGYPPAKAAAIEVAASTNGQIAPPIMGAAAFIIAEYVNVPYLEVIKAAAIPAFAAYAALFFITHIEADKLGLKGVISEKLPRFFNVFINGIHYFIPVVFLVYQLVILRTTPQKSVFVAICVLAVVMLVQYPVGAFLNKKPLVPAFARGFSDIISSLSSGAKNMVTVALATASAGIIVGIVAMGPGGLITHVIGVLSLGNIYLMLIMTAAASLILGMGLPTTANYIVMASLTAPAIVAIAQTCDFTVPLIAAHLFCFFFGILADDTPPVGLAAYAASAIAKSPPIATGVQGFTYDIRTAILPFMFIFNADIILHNIASFPQAVLIFIATCLGSFAFASITQGWFVCRNKFYDYVLLAMVSIIMFRPGAVAGWLGIAYEKRYYTFLIGLAVYLLIYFTQKYRKSIKPQNIK